MPFFPTDLFSEAQKSSGYSEATTTWLLLAILPALSHLSVVSFTYAPSLPVGPPLHTASTMSSLRQRLIFFFCDPPARNPMGLWFMAEGPDGTGLQAIIWTI